MASHLPTPDLASVLRTLATVGAANNHQSTSMPPTSNTYQHQFHIQAQSYSPKAPTESRSTFDSINTAQYVQPDSTMIVDWPTGLKHVMKVVARSEEVMKDIKRMIEASHEHEAQWWAGRQALMKKQEARVEGQKKLDDVMNAIGAPSISTNTKSVLDVSKDELIVYDQKVHRAQRQMVEEMNAKLCFLKIPFFNTRKDLVEVKAADLEISPRSNFEVNAVIGCIDEVALIKLQKRMLSLLQDLCQD